MKTILTGIRVNSELTLGNFLGALLPMTRLANKYSDDHNVNIFVADLHTIIAASGKLKKELLNQNISLFLSEKIDKREKMLESYFKEVEIIEGKKYNCSYVSNPIIKDGECIGLILIFSLTDKLNIEQLQISNIVSSFITKYLEE